MEFTFKFWSNCAILYCFLIIIINGVKIHYVENNHIPEYNPDSNTGCVIHDLQHITNYSAAYIGLAFAIVLLLMCMQNLGPDDACSFDDAACSGMPVCLAFMAYIGVFIASCNEFQKGELDYDDSTPFKKISEFVITGCDETMMNVIYAGLLITTLPMIILAVVIGCFIVGSILYGIGYLFWKWISSCCDCEVNCNKKQSESNNTNDTGANYSWQYECPVIITPPVANKVDNSATPVYHMRRSVSYTSLAPSYVSMPPAYTDVVDNKKQTDTSVVNIEITNTESNI